jgi:predicted  nucleic acid-binding Zn-ribbon protein
VKDSKIKNAETNPTEAQLRITDQATRICGQDKELEIAHSKLKEAENHYEHEVRSLKNKIESEAEKSSKLSKALMSLRETCSSFMARSSTRLHKIFNSVGAVSEKKNYSIEDIPKASISWRRKLMNLTK